MHARRWRAGCARSGRRRRFSSARSPTAARARRQSSIAPAVANGLRWPSAALGDPVEAHYALLADGTAVIEMAAAAGLALLKPGQVDPWRATTFGVGELMRDAAARGAKRIIVGLGGSATNDAGVGMASALGWEFGAPPRQGRSVLPA